MQWAKEAHTEGAIAQSVKLEQDRKQLHTSVITTVFKPDCGCNQCAPQHYNDSLCCRTDQQRLDLVINPGEDASSSSSFDEAQNKFEALHLVDITINYFSQPEHEWSTDQRAVLAGFRRLHREEP